MLKNSLKDDENEQSHLNYYSYSGSKNGKLIEAATGSEMEFI